MSRDLSPKAAELAMIASELPAEDVQRLTRLLQLMKAGGRPAQDEATRMLQALPQPDGIDELRARQDAVIEYLERRERAQ